MRAKGRGSRRGAKGTGAADVPEGATSVPDPASPPGPEREESVARQVDPPIASEDEKDARIRELEARVAELEKSGEKAGPEPAAAVTEPDRAVEALRECEQRLHLQQEELRDAERKQAEAALRESEQRFRLALSNAPVSVAAQDRDLRFLWAFNQRTVNSAEVIGKTDTDLFPPDDAARLMALKRQAIESGAEVREQLWLTSNGQRLFLDLCLVPTRDAAGQVTGIGIATVDLTAMKQAEAALRAANLQLAEADRRKNEFLAVLSHELRNPLAPIKNSLYILSRATSGGDQARRAQAVIERQVDQLARLVDDLLDVTRITRNKIKLQLQRLELNQLVRHAIQDQRSLFDKAEVHLELHPAPRPVFVNADWNRLAQVIGNLLQNAAKFTGRGGATLVTVHAERAERRAVIQVVDTGVGMTPEMVSRLFQPFSQADSSLDRSKGGLGLGLALVKGLVELHGGQVTAQSAGLDKGAEFTVQLPLAMEEAAASQVGSESPAKRRRRVLVIEDSIDAADSLREVLAFGEHEVEVAYNGPGGIAEAREFRPEVVLCDLGLPVMDGYEVARAFKADESLKGIFLVALSGSSFPEDLQRASEAGFDRHLTKPPSLEKLEELLAEVP